MSSIEDLSTLIDSEYLINYLNDDPEEKPEEDELFSDSSPIKSYCDKKVSKSSQGKFIEILDELIGCSFDYEEFEFTEIEGKFYKCEENEIIFGYAKCGKEDHVYIVSKIESDGEAFMMIGNVGSHPFIVTDTFVYDNSDGSGPNMFNIKDINKVNDDLIIHKIYTYFIEFCNNQFH